MKNIRNVLRWLAALQLIMLAAVSVSSAQNQSGLASACFQNKNTGNPKTGCYKFQGKNDASPYYKCPDIKSGKLSPFDPKDEWVALENAHPLCQSKSKTEGVREPIRGNDDDEVSPETSSEQPTSSKDKQKKTP